MHVVSLITTHINTGRLSARKAVDNRMDVMHGCCVLLLAQRSTLVGSYIHVYMRV